MTERLNAPERETDLPDALRELPEKERVFVLAYIEHGNAAQAARDAGFGEEGSKALTFARIGHRLLTRERVRDAVIAICKPALRSLMPKAVHAIKETLEMPMTNARDRLRAAGMVLDRTDAIVQRIEGEITHTHAIDHTAEALNQLRALKALGVAREKLEEIFGFGGLQKYEAMLAEQDARKPNVIEAEYRELPAPAVDPDADILGE